jgi:hypothetical protein
MEAFASEKTSGRDRTHCSLSSVHALIILTKSENTIYHQISIVLISYELINRYSRLQRLSIGLELLCYMLYNQGMGRGKGLETRRSQRSMISRLFSEDKCSYSGVLALQNDNRLDHGFSIFDLNNALKHAQGPIELRVIEKATINGVKSKRIVARIKLEDRAAKTVDAAAAHCRNAIDMLKETPLRRYLHMYTDEKTNQLHMQLREVKLGYRETLSEDFLITKVPPPKLEDIILEEQIIDPEAVDATNLAADFAASVRTKIEEYESQRQGDILIPPKRVEAEALRNAIQQALAS